MNAIPDTAEYFHQLRQSPDCIDAVPAAHEPEDLAEAYRIQDVLAGLRLDSSDARTIGYKIACTSKHAQDVLDVHQPLFGRLLSSTTYPDPADLPADEFRVRCIEPEFGFRMAADVPPREEPYNEDAIARYVGAALPSLEIVDHRFEDWSSVGALALVADNAIHAAWVYGSAESRWQHLDLAAQEVSLRVNGQAVRSGYGHRVLGHPLRALAWLANELPSYGQKLQAGDYVTTGVCTDVYFAAPGDRLEARFGPLGSVQLTYND